MGALAEFLLFWASRSELGEKEVLPALARGMSVLYDRFFPSTFAYQIRGRQKPFEALFNILEQEVFVALKPDCYIFLDISPEEGMARAGKRGAKDKMEQESMEFHRRVYAGYKEFFSTRPHHVVDARKPEDEVFQEVLAIVTKVCV